MLTDQQIWQTATDCTIGGDLHADKFTKAIEKATIAKLAAGVSVEPVHEVWSDGHWNEVAQYFYDSVRNEKMKRLRYTPEAIAAARVQALEEAAKECDDCKDKSRNHLIRSAFGIAASEIRALIGEKTC